MTQQYSCSCLCKDLLPLGYTICFTNFTSNRFTITQKQNAIWKQNPISHPKTENVWYSSLHCIRKMELFENWTNLVFGQYMSPVSPIFHIVFVVYLWHMLCPVLSVQRTVVLKLLYLFIIWESQQNIGVAWCETTSYLKTSTKSNIPRPTLGPFRDI